LSFKNSNFFVPRHNSTRAVGTRCIFKTPPAQLTTASNKEIWKATPNSHTRNNIETTPVDADEDDPTNPDGEELRRSPRLSPNPADLTPKTPTPFKGMSVRVRYPQGWYTGKVKKVNGKKMNVKFFDGTFTINWQMNDWKVKE